jgi:glucose/arabinose dehydrogenase
MKPLICGSLLAMLGAYVAVSTSPIAAAALPSCDPDNGGIKLPDGFCALVVADNLGTARHLTVAPNGDLYVAIRNGQNTKGGVVALRDTNGDGKADAKERFSDDGGTGIAIRNGYLYFAHDTSVVRYRMKEGQLVPDAAPETIVADLPVQRGHATKSFAFDGKGSMYLNVGAPSNACQSDDRKPKVPGQDPCPLLERHGGIWRFDENKPGQTQMKDGKRYATGMRQMIALAWHAGGLYVAMHGRDALDTLWPGLFTAQQNAELPSETLLRVDDGSNFGWPYCYHDWQQNKLFLNPEYGGDGKKTDRCEQYTPPLVGFPGHWAPNDLLFYTGAQFPTRYQNGALVAFHGSWNRAPLPQDGYKVVFVPFSGPTPAGKYETFADGFAGKTPLAQPDDAAFRPMGLAQGPDGSLYISETQKGRIWRIVYRK